MTKGNVFFSKEIFENMTDEEIVKRTNTKML